MDLRVGDFVTPSGPRNLPVSVPVAKILPDRTRGYTRTRSRSTRGIAGQGRRYGHDHYFTIIYLLRRCSTHKNTQTHRVKLKKLKIQYAKENIKNNCQQMISIHSSLSDQHTSKY